MAKNKYMKTKKSKLLAVLTCAILAMTCLTGCSAAANAPVAEEMPDSEIFHLVKSAVFDSFGDYKEGTNTSRNTIYGQKLEKLFTECDNASTSGYVSLYDSDFTVSKFGTAENDKDACAVLAYLASMNSIAFKVGVSKEYAIQYVNNYYVYGESFILSDCSKLAEEFGIADGLVLDSILYANGNAIMIYLVNYEDLDEGRTLAQSILPWATLAEGFMRRYNDTYGLIEDLPAIFDYTAYSENLAPHVIKSDDGDLEIVEPALTAPIETTEENIETPEE